MANYRVGLALGGGAARGWSHIGVIDALIDAGIAPQVVAGTSMGALVGGAYACGRLDALRDWAAACDLRAIAALTDVSLTRGGLVDGSRIRALMGTLGIDRPIEALEMPYAAIATDLADGREVWLREGPVDTAISASIAMPGVFSPVLSGNRWLVDGGLVNKVPVSAARALGADFVIAVSVSEGLLERNRDKLRPDIASAQDEARVEQLLDQVPAMLREPAGRMLAGLFGGGPRTPGYFDVLVNSLNIMQDKITRSRLAGEPPHVLIMPQVSGFRLMDFDRAADAIAAGRAAAERALPEIFEALGR